MTNDLNMQIMLGHLHGASIDRGQVRGISDYASLPRPDKAGSLVTVLHVGYGWTALGLVLLGVDGLVDGLPISAVHALTAGGVSTMTLAVMTRASLGHSDRPLHASPAIVTIYALVNLGALLRVTADLWPMDYTHTVAMAGSIWASGLFALRCQISNNLDATGQAFANGRNGQHRGLSQSGRNRCWQSISSPGWTVVLILPDCMFATEGLVALSVSDCRGTATDQ